MQKKELKNLIFRFCKKARHEAFHEGKNWKGRICQMKQKEARFLYNSVNFLKNGTIVEIGRARGGSTILMAMSSPTSHIYSIDIRDKWDAYTTDLFRVYEIENCSLIHGDSKEVSLTWNKDIDILLIDAHHYEEYVLTDLESWVPKVVVGGLVLMHDFFDPPQDRVSTHGVYYGAKKYNERTNSLKDVALINTLKIFQRIE